MAGFQIRRRFSHHVGGTKAYQIWEVQHNAAVVTVFQWGSFSTGMDPLSMGGTCNVNNAMSQWDSERFADKQQREKTGRGYREWDVDTCPCPNESEFNTIVKTVFGKRAAQVFAQLKLYNESNPLPATAPENDDEGDTKAPVIEIEQSSPEWGSW
jgi:hypothetical protein